MGGEEAGSAGTFAGGRKKCKRRAKILTSVALVLVTFLGAFFGDLITRYVPVHYLQVVAGLLFIAMGAGILWQAMPAVRQMLGRMP
ncbi:MAG: hypothetical protein PWQ41_97 [Bacillota bacterium]|jgi:putative Ca2+/H+ antiporter (TMEM165/GDT1 family)|nr:hypothetical protein [Bacillota bacterium]MDK2924323.1 hypothetical protein [Bacillota bacterium]